MNILLWILQVVLALHTAMGAVWKLSNSEQNVPSLKAIPHGAWRALMGLELLCSVGLLVPAVARSLGLLAAIGALGVAAEMLLFCGVHLASGDRKRGPMIYWLVVAAVGALLAYGRLGRWAL